MVSVSLVRRGVRAGVSLSLLGLVVACDRADTPPASARGTPTPPARTTPRADPALSPTPDTLRLTPGRSSRPFTRSVEVYLNPAEPLPAAVAALLEDPVITDTPVAVVAYWIAPTLADGAARLCRPGRRLPPIPVRTDCSEAERAASQARLEAMTARFRVIRASAQRPDLAPPVLVSPDLTTRGLRAWPLDSVQPPVLRTELLESLGLVRPLPPLQPLTAPR